MDTSVLFGEHIAKQGHKVDWILQSEAPCSNSYEDIWQSWTVYVGATDHGNSRLSRIKKHFLGLKNDLKVFKLAKTNAYNFIQVKDKYLSALIALVAAKHNRCGFVYWLSYPFPEASIYEAKSGSARYRMLYLIRGYLFKFIFYQIIAPHADLIFVQSEQMKRDLEAEGINKTKMQAVPMGYSPEIIENITTDPIADISPVSFVYIGTLLQTRHLDFLVRVLAIVVKEIPAAVLYMVGPEELPGDKQILQNEANRLGMSDRLVLTGRLERSKALSYVAHAGVCVSPFFPTPILNSTSPTKLIEYMAMKKPVVANDHPEQLQVITDSQGGICVEYSEIPFAQAIIALLKEPNKAKSMGEKGYQYVSKNRSYSQIANQVQMQYFKMREEMGGSRKR
ncbi:MAG: glycosyltransferase [Pseudomonadales bacterium]|nr:glycosyltransferase [Pseudomonadales bacterium]